MREDSRIAARVLLLDAAMPTLSTRLVAALSAALAVFALQGCGASPDGSDGNGSGAASDGNMANSVGDDGDDTADGPMVAVDDGVTVGTTHQGLSANQQMTTTANLNLRKGAGTSFAVLAVIPSGATVTVVDPTPSNGFLHITFSGTSGWSSASYLKAAATGGGSSSSSSSGGSSSGGSSGGSGAVDLEGATSPDNAVARALASVGFSYYWGGGAWLDSGPSSSTRGSCTGSCPSCTHAGSYGADCSGMVAKAWQFGTKALSVDSHPYSTASFVVDSAGHWSTVSRGSLRKGDALVYNSGGHGHIAMYESGDGWGSPTVIECRGCSYGCVHDTRAFASTYKGIRRAGF